MAKPKHKKRQIGRRGGNPLHSGEVPKTWEQALIKRARANTKTMEKRLSEEIARAATDDSR